MLKRFFELFGLVAMGVGVYFIVVERPKQNVCNTSEGKIVGFGMSPQCQHVVYAYFGGFILLAAGALVVLFGLLASRRASNHKPVTKNPSLASQYHYGDHMNDRSTQS
jgi:hypothetical protein